MTDHRIYQIGLTMINGVGDLLAHNLLSAIGDPEMIFNEKPAHLERIQGIGRMLALEIKRPEVLRRAEKELAFVEKNRLSLYYIQDPAYPERLRNCPDAPVVFYYKGNARLDEAHVLSIVGTRNATPYGTGLTEQLVADLAKRFPDLLVVSGLAYGIDICAHRSALKNQLPTVAVLAHGMDRIYPAVHRSVAVNMLEHGGLLTDFPSNTDPDRPNFLKRNRLIAGLSDATIVAESAEHGGSLVTADIAFSYNRDVFCFPGRVDDLTSKGCNRLIQQNKAGLILSAEDLIEALQWDQPKKHRQQEIVFEEKHHLEEKYPLLAHFKSGEEVQLNDLAVQLDIPVHQLSSMLFSLEMEGLIKSLPGGRYKLS